MSSRPKIPVTAWHMTSQKLYILKTFEWRLEIVVVLYRSELDSVMVYKQPPSLQVYVSGHLVKLGKPLSRAISLSSFRSFCQNHQLPTHEMVRGRWYPPSLAKAQHLQRSKESEPPKET